MDGIESGDIVISPFYETQLSINSYDMHLSNKLFKVKEGAVFDVLKDNSKNFVEIDLDNYPDGINLQPNTLYLGVTVEYTETHNSVPTFEGNSSNGRMGLETHICAGVGDLGYCGHWTLEIRTMYPIRVVKGMPIGQIIYNHIDKQKLTYKQAGSYNNKRENNPTPVIPNLHLKRQKFI